VVAGWRQAGALRAPLVPVGVPVGDTNPD
jgi:hypothetical protein